MDRKLALTIMFAGADRLSGTMKKIVGLGEKGTTTLAKMKREARDLDRQLASVRADMAGASGNITQLVNRERQLEKAIAGVNRAAERQKTLLTIDNRVGRMQAHAANARAAGQENMIGGAAMLAPLVIMGKGAMDFSSGMVDLQQKADLTNRELVVMQGNILAAAKATHQLPEDMRAAVDVLAGFGLDARQAVKLAQPIGRLGTAFKVDLADGAAAAYANMNNLKVPLGEVARSFDIMAEGGKMGAFEIKDMARHFPALTAQMQALGQKGTPAVADLTAALQVAMNTAGSADEAANNIVNLMGKINSPTVINAFAKKFGVDLPAAMKKARAEGKTTMEAFAEIANKATGGDLAKLSWVVEDRQAQMGVMALIQNMEQYRKIRADIGKASGTVGNAFSQREMNDARMKWAAFMSQAQATGIVLGAKLLPAATQLMGVVGGVVGAVGDWTEANPRLASGIITVIGGMAMARVGIGALQFAFGSILGPMAQAWGFYQKWKTAGAIAGVFTKAAGAFGMLRTAALFLGRGMMQAGLMMLANPMVLIITAIVVALGVAGYLIYTHWDRIKAGFTAGVAAVQGAWVSVKGAVNAGVAFLRGLPGQMLSIGMNIVQGLARGILSAPGAVWNALKLVVMGGVANVKAMLGIKSPSRLFMGIGGYMTEGLAIGLDRGAKQPLGSVSRLAAGVAGAMALSSPAAAQAAHTPNHSAGARAAGGGGGGDTFHITIQQQPGENAEALARRVADLIQRQKADRNRGAYRDD